MNPKHLHAAKKIFKELKNLDRCRKTLLTSEHDSDFTVYVASMIKAKLAYAKQCFSCTLRKQEDAHRDLFLVPADTDTKLMKKEHLTPIDTAWTFAATLDYNSESDLHLLAEYLKEYIYVRVFLSLEDNETVNSPKLNYPGATNKMPKGWKPGDCRFVRYKCLGKTKVDLLKKQLARL